MRRLHSCPLVLLLALTGACGGGGRPLPLPFPNPGGGLPSRETLIDIGHRQPYDPNPGASDRAMIEEGVEVTIEPQDGAWRLSEARLGQGAIVAELRNHSRQAVPEYALEPGGRSFWVVYRKESEWVSAFISDSKNQQLDRFDVPTVIHRPNRPWRQSIAQWQLTGILDQTRPGGSEMVATGMMPWVTCLEQGCCKVGN